MVDYIDFEDWMYERFSKSTIIDTLRKIKYLGKRLDLSSMDSMLEFLREERRNGSPKQKVNGYIKYLNRLLTFEGLDKIDYIHEHRNNSFRKRAFDPDQIQTLIMKSKGKIIEEKRNHAMILLALNTGLRRSEICNLKVEDIHNNFLTVNYGKGEKNRDVFLDENTRKIIMDYAFIRNNNDIPYLFTTKKGKVTAEYMGNIAQDIKKKTGINEFSWHKCRHTYAHNMIKNDIDLETLRQMLGHEDLATTGIYSKMNTEEALERIKSKSIKFYNDSSMFKSSKPCDINNGLKGI